MFAYRGGLDGPAEGDVQVHVAFTDSSLDLQGTRPDFLDALDRVEDACGVRFARLTQVHGSEVLEATGPMQPDEVPTADALVTDRVGLGLMTRVADCVPLLLADPDAGLVAAVHAGRPGMVLDIATRAVDRLAGRGATAITGWIGPHVCGGCYEVPEQMREEVAAALPEAWAETTWGTPSVDIGAGVRAQLERAGVAVVEVGGCTRESAGLHSFRRDADRAGRMAGLIWMSAGEQR